MEGGGLGQERAAGGAIGEKEAGVQSAGSNGYASSAPNRYTDATGIDRSLEAFLKATMTENGNSNGLQRRYNTC